jgi:hypothetical protein
MSDGIKIILRCKLTQRDNKFTIIVNVTVNWPDVSLCNSEISLFLIYIAGTETVNFKPFNTVSKRKIHSMSEHAILARTVTHSRNKENCGHKTHKTLS